MKDFAVKNGTQCYYDFMIKKKYERTICKILKAADLEKSTNLLKKYGMGALG
jgi:hypothetical protein